MAYARLPTLRLGIVNQLICLRLARLSFQRGGLEVGLLKYMHLVFVDEEGYQIYARVIAHDVHQNVYSLQEGKVYEITRFAVIIKNQCMRPTRALHTMVFLNGTEIEEIIEPLKYFPRWAFHLTELSQLPNPVDAPDYLVDVIGIITGVSDVTASTCAQRSLPICTRYIRLKDLSGHEIQIMLVGNAATLFDGNAVRNEGKEKTMVAIFVGTLVRNMEGLYGNCAVAWYINEDIEPINSFHALLEDNHVSVMRLTCPPMLTLQPQSDGYIPETTVDNIVNYDLFTKRNGRFICTVTITAVPPSIRWWFASCTECGSSAVPDGPTYGQSNGFLCTGFACESTSAVLKYKICATGTDGTDYADFLMVEDVGHQIVKATVAEVLSNIIPENSLMENIQFCVDTPTYIPNELAQLLGCSYKLAVGVNEGSFLSKKPTFRVIAVQDVVR